MFITEEGNRMFKQVLVILAVTIATIFFKNQLSHVLDILVSAHNYVGQKLHLIFADDKIGRIIQDMLALLLIPILCGLLVAAIFWLMKRGAMPQVMMVVWSVWLVLLVAMVAHNGHTTPTLASRNSSHLHGAHLSMK